MLTLFNLAQLQKGPKMMCSPIQVHITTSTGSILEAPEIQIFPQSSGLNSVRYRRVPLYIYQFEMHAKSFAQYLL